MLKKTLSALITVIMLFSALTSCSEVQKSNDATARAPFDENGVRDWIRRNMERYRIFGFGLWAVCLKDSGEMIGDCGLTMQLIDGMIRPEIGYHIRSDHQRRGYAAEAACAVRDWIFEHTPFQVVYSYMKYTNEPSARTAMAYGCREIGGYVNEDNEQTRVFALSREAWKKRI